MGGVWGVIVKLPELFEDRMKELLKDEYDEFSACFDEGYAAGIRVNTLKADADDFESMCSFGLKRIPFIKNGFYYSEENKPSKHPYYYAGLYYIQEPSAMAPASLLPIVPGDRVLDLCAAPGGKSTELGAKLCGEGVLVSNDISNSRAKALLKNIELFGIKNAVVVSEAPAKLAQEFEGFFDKILVDAPCSGEGMFRKTPTIMKNWEQYGVEYYNKLQKEILPYAVRMLKPGGCLLYSTCTFSPEEDEGTINWLLNQHPELTVIPNVNRDMNLDYSGFSCGRPDWISDENIKGSVLYDEMLVRCIRLWPHKIGGEGHFIALLKKDGEAEEIRLNNMHVQPIDSPSAKSDMGVNKNRRKEWNKGISDEAYKFLDDLDMPVNPSNIMVKDERLYLLPEGIGTLKGLRVLRSGLLLGEQKKGRFEPSQALACALKMKEYNNVYELDSSDEDVLRYLKCESIELKKEVKAGWVLVCVDGFPLGWGKAGSGGSFKNKYLPGWRMM